MQGGVSECNLLLRHFFWKYKLFIEIKVKKRTNIGGT